MIQTNKLKAKTRHKHNWIASVATSKTKSKQQNKQACKQQTTNNEQTKTRKSTTDIRKTAKNNVYTTQGKNFKNSKIQTDNVLPFHCFDSFDNFGHQMSLKWPEKCMKFMRLGVQ